MILTYGNVRTTYIEPLNLNGIEMHFNEFHIHGYPYLDIEFVLSWTYKYNILYVVWRASKTAVSIIIATTVRRFCSPLEDWKKAVLSYIYISGNKYIPQTSQVNPRIVAIRGIIRRRPFYLSREYFFFFY